jgi:hypothetical protein
MFFKKIWHTIQIHYVICYEPEPPALEPHQQFLPGARAVSKLRKKVFNLDSEQEKSSQYGIYCKFKKWQNIYFNIWRNFRIKFIKSVAGR